MTIFVIIENWDFSLPSIFFFLSSLSFLFLHPLFPSFEVLMNFSVFPFFLSQIGNSRCHFRSFETFILRYTLFLYTFVYIFRGFPGGSDVKKLPAMQETRAWSLGWEEPLEKEMAAHSSILAWRIPRTEAPGGLKLMKSQRVGLKWAANTFHFHFHRFFCNKVYSYLVCLCSSQTGQRVYQMLTTFMKE